jgi:outer membrane receptor protein involved in Fe transport
LAKLAPESLMNYEFGFRFQTRRLYARAQGFNAELYDPIVRRTLLFSADNVPDRLAGIPVTVLPQSGAQRDQRVVTVATPFDPRSVKAFVNDGRARYYGIEALANYTVSSRWSLSANYSFLAGRELNPNRNMRRLPPQSGAATVRYTPSGRRIWFEVSLAAAGPQERLSGGDLDDERIGASRRRQDIADFFHGARVRPFLDPVTGVFRPTGETLLQIQDRVLPAGVVVNGVRVVNDATRVPLYLSTAGWATANVRAGVPLGERWRLLLALENLADKQYRFHGSGVDAPGIGAYANLRFSF